MALLRIKKQLIHNFATLGCQVLATKAGPNDKDYEGRTAMQRVEESSYERLLRLPLEFFFVVQ
jgi:hypothetical protein